MHERFIYHLCRSAEWEAALAAGSYTGSSQDRADRFIHFSAPGQLVASAAKHRAGQKDLVLLEVEAERLRPALVWEPSRGGALFPHLYGALKPADVNRVWPLPLDDDGLHRFPDDLGLAA
ncbi:MAG: DUF952 domain-containing protein [Rhodospirillales bacterium]|nr:DUF952 domain-containing protein [Rhodospirillales bacterium]